MSQLINANILISGDSLRIFAKDALEFVPKFILGLFYGAEKNIKGRERMVSLLLIVFGTNLYYWNQYSFWSRRGVKTPRPLPFFGNFFSFMSKPRQTLQLEWPKQYGKIYGYYMGIKPYLVCADAHVLKKICIRDFDKFPNHFFVGVKNKFQKHFLVMQRDDHWRGMRAILTPTFTSGKMKIMFKLLDDGAEELVKQQRARIDRSSDGKSVIVDSRKLSGAFSIGSALTSFYGMKLNYSVDDEEDAYTKDGFAARSQRALAVTPFRFLVTSLIPQSILKFLNFPQTREGPMEFFYENAKKIIQRRQNAGKRYNDYLQLLIEARADNELEIAESDKHEQHHALLEDTATDNSNGHTTSNGKLSEVRKIKMTEMEVTCQAMMLMVVATETTSTLICNTIYLLAHHQDIQEKLYQELVKIMIPKEDRDQTNRFDYEQLASCLYLDCVISESLRFMPPALAMDREASEDYYIEDYNISVPKGTTINLDYFAIHRDPEYWPEPEKFDPERFKPENKAKIIPGSYCPFGIGPRSCIGFRFALTEAKVGLAKLVTEFKISRAPGTKYPPEPKNYTTPIINEMKDLMVSLSRRD